MGCNTAGLMENSEDDSLVAARDFCERHKLQLTLAAEAARQQRQLEFDVEVKKLELARATQATAIRTLGWTSVFLAWAFCMRECMKAESDTQTALAELFADLQRHLKFK